MKLALTALVAMGACAPNDSGSTLARCEKLSPTPAKTPTGWNGSVFTIVMENRSRSEIFGNKRAPFINKIASQAAVADGYHDSFVHPSEANYLWMVSGENFGVLDDDDPKAHPINSGSHIADQIELGGLSWRSYQESMGKPCGLKSHGRYAAKHDPFVFFDDVNGWDGKSFEPSQRCIDNVVDFSQLDVDIATHNLPNYAFITPNLDDDMHDGTIAEGDAWLSRVVPKIMATDAYKNGGVIFILWDEGGGTPASDDPPFIALSPNAKVGHNHTVYNTSSYLKTVEGVLGLTPLPCDTSAAHVLAMSELFTVPLAPQQAESPVASR